ncbi:MAG: DUF1501 domain-containing protein [Verrucomicrobiota bacterium]
MTARTTTRRQFLGQASCAAVGSVGLLSTLFNLRMANSAAAQSIPSGNDYRGLVCLFLSGGIDSYNVLFPSSSAGVPYGNYLATRGGLYDASTNRDGLALPTAYNLPSSAYSEYGLAIHSKFADYGGLPGLGSLFTSNKAAFITNVGTLVERTSKTAYTKSTARLPRGLYSHSDQVQQWHTSVAIDSRTIGWAGQAADLLQAGNTDARVSMNISLGGDNVWQAGHSLSSYSIGSSGSTLPYEYISPFATPVVSATSRGVTRTAAYDNLLQQEYQNLFERAFIGNLHNSVDNAAAFQDAFNTNLITTPFPGDAAYTYPNGYTASNDPARTLGQQLKAVVRSIKARTALGMRRQTFFVNYGGWDHHDEVVLNMDSMLDTVNRCLISYWQALGEIGMQDQVTLYSASDFGRTLTSNGAGSDHAWGGNQFVLGGAVQGGRVYGSYPDLSLNGSSIVTSRGITIPGVSCEEYFAELALWLGVGSSDLPSVLPRIRTFYTPGSALPLGFMKV